MRVTERVDGYQRRHRWAGSPLAVIYKFFEDQGPFLAARSEQVAERISRFADDVDLAGR